MNPPRTSNGSGLVSRWNPGSTSGITPRCAATGRSPLLPPSLVPQARPRRSLSSESDLPSIIEQRNPEQPRPPKDMSHAITPSGRAINPWWIGLALTLATFMELLDTSIANVALPHIAGGLGTSLDE